MKKIVFRLLIAFLAIVSIISCSKSDDEPLVTQTKTILSSASLDGSIENYTIKTPNTSYYRLQIGWNGGYASRAFLSFDLSSVLPTAADQKMVIEKAVLKVYEQNTNMMPFTGEGGNRVVETYLLNYGTTLTGSAFGQATLANCGVIAVTGYSVLTEHPLDVTSFVSAYYNGSYTGSPYTATQFQFRLQFTNNDNVNSSSTLDNAMWCIYSGDDQGANLNPYRPVLQLIYHYEKR
jgi:hypothetical protein